MNRRLRLRIALLALGTVAGYAAGFAHLHHACEWHRQHPGAMVQAWGGHGCVDAPTPPR